MRISNKKEQAKNTEEQTKREEEAQRSHAWATNELAALKGKDPRSIRRLHAVMAAMHQRPGASLPECCGAWSDTKAAYRLLDSGEIDGDDVLETHYKATVERIRQRKCTTVLVLQDTTSLNYSTHTSTEGLGPIGSDEKVTGIFLHEFLCIDADTGEALGLAGAKFWVRDEKALAKRAAGARNREKIEDKESYRWLEGFEKAQRLSEDLDGKVKVICSADREGDIYELFALQKKQRCESVCAELLVRAQHDRELLDDGRRIRSVLDEVPVVATKEVTIPARPGKKSRCALLQVRCIPDVKLAVPVNVLKYTGAHEPLKLSVVFAREEKPPAGEEALEWMLWSSEKISDEAGALRALYHYEKRWQIEVLHRVLKSVCRVERRQVRSASKLGLLVVVDLLISVYLMGLMATSRSRPETPAREWLTSFEERALYGYIKKRSDFPETGLKLGEVVKWLGSLGGHLGRKSDGPPGPKSLWLGLLRLQDITDVWVAAGKFHPAAAPKTCG
jgi:hypothetical protein